MNPILAIDQRLDGDALEDDISAAIINPVVSGLLNTVSGLLAVLNEHRQILALNDAFLHLLGIDDPQRALGLRPGEALGCIYHEAGESGCGTSAHCVTCGAAIAMVACLHQKGTVEKDCALTVEQHQVKRDLFLRIRACPITVEGRRLILLFMQDISRQQQWEALGRVFFHDLSNIIYGLVGNAEMLLDKADDDDAIVRKIHRLSLRLAREVQMQKHITQMADADYRPMIQPVAVESVFGEVEAAFSNHPAANHRTLVFDAQNRQQTFKSDFFLVVRVLTNMITNALEASDKGRSVKVWATSDGERIVFHVWNHQVIPENVVGRIFQRNISTKAASGRGLGTYSMKFFGENFLKGTIDFTTSESAGTTFRFSLPLTSPESGQVVAPMTQAIRSPLAGEHA